MQRLSGLIDLTIDGAVYTCKGAFEYHLGVPRREPVLGENGAVVGYNEVPQENYISGAIQDRGDLDLQTLLSFSDATVTLRLANGKALVQRGAAFMGDGTVSTDSGNIAYRSVGLSMDEVAE